MPDIPDQEAWNAWHPRELAARLAGIDRPWCVVGGWALDLWHGHETRAHHDLEFTMLRADFDLFRRTVSDTNFAFYAVRDGNFEFLPDEMDPGPSIAQIWCRDVAADCWRVDMMIEPGTPETWICKRAPAIARPRAEAVLHSPEGIPYLAPAAILLLKAKHGRPKDEADFEMALPKLDAGERAWLRAGLARLHPGHGWIDRL